MGNIYLTWMADELRAVGLDVREESGWQQRSRSSGGYDGNKPWIVMLHHTASQTSSKNDVSYMCYSSDARPTANIYIGREGDVWIMAAGATNTNGKGRSRTVSKGTIPQDSMNLYAVGIELGNNGVGETYPQAQIDAMFDTVICLLDKLGLEDEDVGLHEWYSPGRKIDPADCNVEGPWKPYPWTGNNAGTWDLYAVWDEIKVRRHGAPPDDGDDDMPKAAVYTPNDDPKGPWIWWDGTRCGWVRDPDWLGVGRMTGVYSNTTNSPLTNFNKAQITRMIETSWADSGAKPPGYGG